MPSCPDDVGNENSKIIFFDHSAAAAALSADLGCRFLGNWLRGEDLNLRPLGYENAVNFLPILSKEEFWAMVWPKNGPRHKRARTAAKTEDA